MQTEEMDTNIEDIENIFNRSILQIFKDFSNNHHAHWLQIQQNMRYILSELIQSNDIDNTSKSQLLPKINELISKHSTNITQLDAQYLQKCNTCLSKRKQVLVAAQQEFYKSKTNSSTNTKEIAVGQTPKSNPFVIQNLSVTSMQPEPNENTNNSNTNRPFKCDYPNCGRDYTTQSYLFDHIRQSHGGKPYKCTQCNQSFARKKDVEAHLRSEHKQTRSHDDYDFTKLQTCMEQCPECNYNTSTLRQLCRHIRNKHKELEQKLIEQQVFKVCDKCNQSYHIIQRHQCNRKNIKPHNFETSPKKTKPNAFFDTSSMLRYSMLSSSHEATSEEDEDEGLQIEQGFQIEQEKPFKCEYADCTSSFSQRKYWAKHVRRVHKGKPYQCQQCEEKFAYDRDLNKHKKECKVYCICRKPQNRQPMISCDYCPEWYHYKCIGMTESRARALKEYKCEACKNARYCICRKPDDGKGLIQCDQCDEWYHYKCINYTKEMAEAIDEYICTRCLNDAASQELSMDLGAPPRKKHKMGFFN